MTRMTIPDRDGVAIGRYLLIERMCVSVGSGKKVFHIVEVMVTLVRHGHRQKTKRDGELVEHEVPVESSVGELRKGCTSLGGCGADPVGHLRRFDGVVSASEHLGVLVNASDGWKFSADSLLDPLGEGVVDADDVSDVLEDGPSFRRRANRRLAWSTRSRASMCG